MANDGRVKVPTTAEIRELEEAIRSLDDASYKAFLESYGSDEEEREEEVEETFVPEAAHREEEEDEERGGWDAEPAEDAAEPSGLEEGIEAEGLDATEGLDELGRDTSSKRTKRSLERAVAAAMSLRRLNETDASALANGNGLRETMRTIPRWMIQDTQPSDMRRPAAAKALENDDVDGSAHLTKLGGGVVWRSSLATRRGGGLPSVSQLEEAIPEDLEPELMWVMYANPRAVGVWADLAFKEDLGAARPEDLADAPPFWQEFSRAAGPVEFTLAVRICRDMSPRKLPGRLVGGLVAALEQEEDSPEAREAAMDLGLFMKELEDNAPVEDLSRVGQLVKALPAPVQKLVRRVRATPKAKIRVPAGSTFIFAARPYGNGFTLEACTPARGRDQQSWFAAQTRNPALLEALMDLFLGPLASPSTRLEITTSLINMVRGLQGKPHLVVKTKDPFKTGPFLQADADTKRQAY